MVKVFFRYFLYRYSIYYDGGIRCSAGSSIDIDIGLRSIAMNAGIAFISRKSRKTDVAWRYAIAVVLVVCCIGLAYVEIVVAPWFINEVVSMFPETTLLKEPSMFWEWAILLAVQATLLCTAAKLVVPERLLAQAAGLLDMIRIVALIVVFSVTTTGNITICLMNFGTPGFVYGVALCSLAAIIAIIVLLKRRRYSTCSMPM
ncbi:hypothetical protein [Bifidobacterium longum]|nr:hypothetical protein [Bifidobacterium longum]